MTDRHAKVRVTTRKSHGFKKEQEETMETNEFDLLVKELAKDAARDGANVVISVSQKVSDSEQYGPGTWDKIPYGCEVFASVKLTCPQDTVSITLAGNVAHELALGFAKQHLQSALAEHVNNIRTELYPTYFDKNRR